MTGRRPFAFVAKQSKNKHSNRLEVEGQVRMRWGERNSVLEKCNREGGGGEGRGWRDKVVCGQSQQREVTICSCFFICLVFLSSARGVERVTKNNSNNTIM